MSINLYTLDIKLINKVDSLLKVPENFTGIVEYPDGTKSWWKNGEIHRLDGPAVENTDGTKVWYCKNELHRLDGPAIEWADGNKEWWINGKEIFHEQQFILLVSLWKLKGLI